jgi:hypothetical protein
MVLNSEYLQSLINGLSSSDIVIFAESFKKSVKEYAKSNKELDSYIRSVLPRICDVLHSPDVEHVDHRVLNDLILGLGFWVKWAPVEYNYLEAFECLKYLSQSSLSIISGASIASIGLIISRHSELGTDEHFGLITDALISPETIVKASALFGLLNIVHLNESPLPEATLQAIVILLTDSDQDVRDDASQILLEYSLKHSSDLIRYADVFEHAMQNDISNSVLSNVRIIIRKISGT